jgi:aminoglycoside/choline kinase family phosphotransferase
MIRAPDNPGSAIAGNGTTAPHDPRLDSLRDWLARQDVRHALAIETLRPASDDASFRRYFRIDVRDRPPATLIVMDAPPALEDCRPFVHAAHVLGQAGIKVPAVIEADLTEGFLLLDDLGSETLLDRLAREPDDADIHRLYSGATQALVTMQAASRPGVFPDYERALLERELMLYPDWYLARHLGFRTTDADREVLRSAFDVLLAENLAQARVFVHRDYHSRNLMIAGDETAGAPNPGVIDFQDAVYGPITYDLVSLLRDAYVSWPEERQIDWAVRWWQSARAAGLPVPQDFGDLWRSFEWMGLQRHLKVLGIFARLHHRDGKSRYLADMPRVLASVIQVAKRYGAFSGLLRLIERAENRAALAPPVSSPASSVSSPAS